MMLVDVTHAMLASSLHPMMLTFASSQREIALLSKMKLSSLLMLASVPRAVAFGMRPLGAARHSSSLAVAQNDFTNEVEHIVHQAQTFDNMAGLFSNTNFLPPEAVAVYQNFSSRFLDEIMTSRQNPPNEPYRVIDIGCGAGVLFKFLLDAANDRGVSMHITGVDLSKVMIQNGRAHAQQVLAAVEGSHSIDAYADDACRHLRGKPGEFDGAIANSCFANFWNQTDCIDAMTTGLRDGGILVVAHPVGSRFVAGLNTDNPNVTPHLMPTNSEFKEMTSSFPLKVLDFAESFEMMSGQTVPMYYVSAVKVTQG
jgi:SAM-dependent methyltransferase